MAKPDPSKFLTYMRDKTFRKYFFASWRENLANYQNWRAVIGFVIYGTIDAALLILAIRLLLTKSFGFCFFALIATLIVAKVIVGPATKPFGAFFDDAVLAGFNAAVDARRR